MEPIAIVGLDCSFPKAAGVEAYWDLLMRGGDAVGRVPAARWKAGPEDVVREGGFLSGELSFDQDFFGIPPREAAVMDPHQQLLLECAWRALEDSGQSPPSLRAAEIGVFVGAIGGAWQPGGTEQLDPQQTAGRSLGLAANRISYHLDLKGPSLVVDTACSSSLTAVHLACAALRAGECDQALAGGVNLVLGPELGEAYAQMGIGSPDGRCKPFSAVADGIGRSDGIGIVVLRRLSDALAAGQRVYAVVRGSAVTQDGRSNGLTAPSRWAQRAVVEKAYRNAGVTPAQVSFVEAHGTGTMLGDAIECAALGDVHGVERGEPCAVGSVKGNIGHAEAAAGVAGLIKVALALHHRVVPASRYATRENRQLRLRERGLRLLKAPLRLPAAPVVAGLSSFGMGGTNVHMVLESAPAPARPDVEASESETFGVFTLSADTPQALQRNLALQAREIGRLGRGDSAAVCWTSNRARSGLRHRFAVPVRNTAELAGALRTAAALPSLGPAPTRPPRPVFLYSGQGVLRPGAGATLYRESPGFRRLLDEADQALRPHLGRSVKELLLSGDPQVVRPRSAQPAQFALQYALSGVLVELGVQPAGVVGHSLGEIAAAVTAGVLTLEEAARLVAARGAACQELPIGGGMLAVRCGDAAVQEVLADCAEGNGRVVLAAVNGPESLVLAGPQASLDRLDAAFRERGVRTQSLAVDRAFHSPLMEPALGPLREALGRVAHTAPRLPFASTLLGRPVADEPLDAAYWVRQLRSPVLFEAALAALDEAAVPTHLIEIGTAPQLLPLVAQTGNPNGHHLLHPSPGESSGARSLLDTVAELYRCGFDPRWDAVYPPEARRLQRLVPYEFSREDDASRPLRAPGDVGVAGGTLALMVELVTEIGGYRPGSVGADTLFYDDLGFDSVMVMQLKDRIDARLPHLRRLTVQQLLPSLVSVGSLAAFLDAATVTT